MSDIIRITLMTNNRQKYFEMDAPMDNADRVRDLLIIAKSKGVNLKEPLKNKKDIEWF